MGAGQRLAVTQIELTALRPRLIHEIAAGTTFEVECIRQHRGQRLAGFAVYRRRAEGTGFQADAVHLLVCDGDTVAEVLAFLGPGLFKWFNAPTNLET